MEKVIDLIRQEKLQRSSNWQKKYLEMSAKYGSEFTTLFDFKFNQVKRNYYGVTPGDAIDIQITKMLCKDSSQAALDSHKVTSTSDYSSDPFSSLNCNYVFTFDRNSLTDVETYYLKKDLAIFDSLGNIIECRRCKQFVIFTLVEKPKKIVCPLNNWVKVANDPMYVGGFGNIFSVTCLHEFTKTCGMLAGTINYSNILTEYERKHKTSMTMILLNVCLLNGSSETLCPLTRNGTLNRREFLTRASFETCKPVLIKAKRNNEIDQLNENYGRIIMQLPPLVGTNFNYFTTI